MAFHNIIEAVRSKLAAMLHPVSGIGWELLPGTSFNYQKDVIPMLNSAVAATVFWIAMNFPEAPLEAWEKDERGNASGIQGHRMS